MVRKKKGEKEREINIMSIISLLPSLVIFALVQILFELGSRKVVIPIELTVEETIGLELLQQIKLNITEPVIEEIIVVTEPSFSGALITSPYSEIINIGVEPTYNITMYVSAETTLELIESASISRIIHENIDLQTSANYDVTSTITTHEDIQITLQPAYVFVIEVNTQTAMTPAELVFMINTIIEEIGIQTQPQLLMISEIQLEENINTTTTPSIMLSRIITTTTLISVSETISMIYPVFEEIQIQTQPILSMVSEIPKIGEQITMSTQTSYTITPSIRTETNIQVIETVIIPIVTIENIKIETEPTYVIQPRIAGATITEYGDRVVSQRTTEWGEIVMNNMTEYGEKTL